MFTEGLDPSALKWVYAPHQQEQEHQQQEPGEVEDVPSYSSPDNDSSDGGFSAESSGSFHVPLNPSIWPAAADKIRTFQDLHDDSPPKTVPTDSDGMVLPPTAPPIVNLEGQRSPVAHAADRLHEMMDSSDHWNCPAVQSFSCEYDKDNYNEYIETAEQFEQRVESSELNAYWSTNQSANQTVKDTKNPSEQEKQAPAVFQSGQASWQSIIAYDACVRLCLRAWSRSCPEAPEFLQNECFLLRTSFGLQQVLLQPKGEQPETGLRDDADSGSGAKPKVDAGKLKVQVRRIRVIPRQPLRTNSMHGNAYLNAGAQYMKQVSTLLKSGVNTLRNTTMLDSQETYSCALKLRSLPEDEGIRVQSGCAGSAVLHPETADELIVEVYDVKGSLLGRSFVSTDDLNDRAGWWPIYSDPDRECIGKVQLSLRYTATSSELGAGKWGAVGETVAYDIVLDAAMKMQQFGRRNLRLTGPWDWLLSEFAVFYGVSNIYSKLRYLANVMEVATPTEDCLTVVYEFLVPIINARNENELNRQEKRMFLEVEEQVSQLLASVFENYKSLDESTNSGISDVFQLGIGVAAPSLIPAVQLFTLLNDILSSEAQEVLRKYFQTAAKKRCKRLLSETDEFVANTSDGFLMDPSSLSTAYLRMKNLCASISTEISADLEIHKLHVLPSSIDLPNITASLYNVEVCNRLRAFLVACPPAGPSPPVADLLIATSDFQRDLASWGIKAVKGGVDAKDLFHLYIVIWIQEKRLHLLEFCKSDKVQRNSTVATQHGTAPFVEDVYDRLKETLNEYEVIISRWPEYTIGLENAVADVERAVITALEKHYADVLSPLKEVMEPKKFTLQYVHKFARRRSLALYSVPNQLGVVLNTIRRLLDVLRPKLDGQMKSWVSCLPVESVARGKAGYGERLNEVTVALRTKYKSLLQAIVQKLSDNSKMHPSTKLKRILQDTREAAVDSEMRDRMQSLNQQIHETIGHLHDVFTSRVFVAVTRGYWDRMARDVLRFLENRKENRSWYRSSCFALGILDDTFASQMQRLQHCLTEKDLEPPRSVMEARSILSRNVDSSNYLF